MAKVNPPVKDETNGALITPPAAQQQQQQLTTSAAPSYMTPVAANETGLELIGSYVRPPRLKTIQKSARPPYSELFDVGDIVAVPQNLKVVPVQKNAQGKPDKFGERFHLVPLFFYPEWCLINPLETQGRLPMIRERSIDPMSKLAKMSQSSKTWFQPCPEDTEHNMRYVECLNYLVRLVNREDEIAGVTLLITFSKGSHQSGTNWAGLIRMNCPAGSNIPICARQYEARSTFTPSSKGDYYRVEVQNPSVESGVPTWVPSKELYDLYLNETKMLRQAYAEKRLMADYDDGDDADTVDATGTTPAF